jgi:hypothetical protein
VYDRLWYIKGCCWRVLAVNGVDCKICAMKRVLLPVKLCSQQESRFEVELKCGCRSERLNDLMT